MIPRGLTDITVHIPTAEQRARGEEARRKHDWRTWNQLREAVVLHFGSQRVHIPISRMILNQLQRTINNSEQREAQRMYEAATYIDPVAAEENRLKEAEETARFKNAWDRILKPIV